MTNRDSATDLAIRLARVAEAVCRKYLPNGHREGNYWVIGDVHNAPGRSMHVRLNGPERGRGAAGKWVDEATGDYGDLLDLIHQSCGLVEFRDVADEARRFLSVPQLEAARKRWESPRVTRGSQGPARRLFAMARPLAGTLAERYLHGRGIFLPGRERSLRFHPTCYYRDLATHETLTLPALIAAVTDLDGRLTGVQRTYLSPPGSGTIDVGKAYVATPRRAMGSLLGNGIRFGFEPGLAIPVMTAGEGLETMASLRMVLPSMPAIAATSANHLAALTLPPGCKRFYISADADAAGRHGIERLSRRAGEAGVIALVLRPQLGDFNDDLRRLGPDRLAAWLRDQLVPEDVERHLPAG